MALGAPRPSWPTLTEGQSGPPLHYQRGILQMPTGTGHFEAQLVPAFRDTMDRHPSRTLKTWVDDLSFDIQSGATSPPGLQGHGQSPSGSWLGLQLNAQKTGFLTSSKEAKRALGFPIFCPLILSMMYFET